MSTTTRVYLFLFVLAIVGSIGYFLSRPQEVQQGDIPKDASGNTLSLEGVKDDIEWRRETGERLEAVTGDGETGQSSAD
ncbi:hypothetical protein [Kiloniella sp. b19]|uniref:hypothetical protein n=1 Tax=Kiloniella sp. GXU_MW_B19 TaxID=3141326 RepID=UPI0031D56C68